MVIAKLLPWIQRLFAWFVAEPKERIPQDFDVAKVLVFKRGHEDEEFQDITTLVQHVCNRTIPKHVIDFLCGWDDWRVEVRYTQVGAKYRVLYYNEDIVLPPYTPEEINESMTLSDMRNFPLSAVISTQHDVDGNEGANVTHRLFKYCGPRKNWYADKGFRLRLADMFPFDDHETNKAFYPYLHVRTIFGVKSYKIYSGEYFTA